MKSGTMADQALAQLRAKYAGQDDTGTPGPARGMSEPTGAGARLPLPSPDEEHGGLFPAEGEGAGAQDEHVPLDVQPDPSEEVAAAVEDEDVRNLPHFLQLPEPVSDSKPPAWFPPRCVPRDLRVPKGMDVMFIRIRGELTSHKHKGDRFLIAWELSDGDEKMAQGRSMGDSLRLAGELAKQMLRVVDGAHVTWSGLPGAGNVDQLWNEIGSKGRNQMQRLYAQLHVFDRTEQIDFFESCVARVRTG